MNQHTNDSKGMNLAIENYGVVKELQYDYALLPWGATEPHNYHLPYLTDCYLAQSIAVDSAVQAFDKYGVRGMVLPAVPFGSQNPGQSNQPFCIHGSYDTQRYILRDIVESLLRQGITKLVIINGHGGNNFKNMIRDFVISHPGMTIFTCEWFKLAKPKDFFEMPDDHADELETSVLMHYHPDLVDLKTAGDGCSTTFAIDALKEGMVWTPRNWEKVAPTTGIGDPKLATAEKGKAFAAAVTKKLASFYNDILTKELY